ncbi:hypothetical protein QBC45DRAFT_112756 [Copromyces sp. CBS 386.78]|nr:hypothetical protein QBC45DRAFT_112756 [Copromyces sp. CBS 386.78]
MNWSRPTTFRWFSRFETPCSYRQSRDVCGIVCRRRSYQRRSRMPMDGERDRPWFKGVSRNHKERDQDSLWRGRSKRTVSWYAVRITIGTERLSSCVTRAGQNRVNRKKTTTIGNECDVWWMPSPSANKLILENPWPIGTLPPVLNRRRESPASKREGRTRHCISEGILNRVRKEGSKVLRVVALLEGWVQWEKRRWWWWSTSWLNERPSRVHQIGPMSIEWLIDGDG